MPLFVASAIRYLLIAAIQIGAFSVAQSLLEKAFDAISNALRTNHGMSAEQAEDSLAAEVLASVLALGANAMLIKSRLPLRWVDKIAKVKKVPTIKATGKITSQAITTPPSSLLYKASLLKTLGVVAASSAVAKLFWIDSTIQNFLDQGTFNPAGANRALRDLGLGGVFQWSGSPKELQPGTYTATEFIELFNQLTAGGAIGINNEFEQQSQMWDQGNLSQLINSIVGTLIIQGKTSDKTAVKKELAKYIISRAGQVPTPTVPTGAKPSFIASPRVFTGVLSQGFLGAGVAFQSRPDDLIESVEELKTAAQNNLVPFLASLPGRVVYELKITPTVTTKDGFTQRGTAQQIVSGYRKDGAAKYRTVVNKFAVLHLYILTERGTRTKIAAIVLGPTDSLKFKPEQGDLAQIEATIKDAVITSDIKDVKNIAAPVKPRYKTDDTFFLARDRSELDLFRTVGDEVWTFKPVQAMLTTEEIQRAGSNAGALPLALERLDSYDIDPSTFRAVPFIADIITEAQKRGKFTGKGFPEFFTGTAPAGSGVEGAPKGAGATATTLYEWYTANGQSLPSVSARSLIYAGFGLGQANYYTGTAEQNAKLLSALQGK